MEVIRIGTRESQLALWQAAKVQALLGDNGYKAELVPIKSDGDTDLKTPLYEIGVQGIFTKALDIALLNKEIDIAVHSMKDVPTMMAKGIVQAAVLPRASYKDLLVPRPGHTFEHGAAAATIATSSIRRRAQWLNRYPEDTIENLRGNVNTRLRKVEESNWAGAIFAAAGLERIGLRPDNAVELDWMLPAPAQGAIIVVCHEHDSYAYQACSHFHDPYTALCTHIERAFLRELMGGCSTPISALATVREGDVEFVGNILSKDGKQKAEIKMSMPVGECNGMGELAAQQLLQNGGRAIADAMNNE
jgi:hydroxymethylbilane synthase